MPIYEKWIRQAMEDGYPGFLTLKIPWRATINFLPAEPLKTKEKRKATTFTHHRPLQALTDSIEVPLPEEEMAENWSPVSNALQNDYPILHKSGGMSEQEHEVPVVKKLQWLEFL